MIARLALAAVAAMGLATAAPAFDLSEMTEDERATFRAEIRAYLLENPEVLMEAIAVLDQREREAQVANDQALVASYAGDLFDDGHSWVGGNPDGDGPGGAQQQPIGPGAGGSRSHGGSPGYQPLKNQALK